MKNKTPSFTFLLFALTLLNSANPLQAQSIITGTLLGHDGQPMKQTMILMTVGGPGENTIIIQPDENGQFRKEIHEKGLLFLNLNPGYLGRPPQRKTAGSIK